jgi:hypothetical protein
MSICDLSTGLIKLTRAAKRLRDQWAATEAHWDDQNAADFEQNHLQPILPQLTLTSAAVNRLAALLVQAERECSDEDESQRL